MSVPRLTVIGECLIDVGPSGVREVPTGDAATLALAAAQTAHVHETCLATALGDDPLSDAAARTLDAAGIRTMFVQRLPGELPALSVRAEEAGDPLIWRNGTAIRRMFPVHPGYLSEVGASDVVALTATSLAVLPEGGRKTLVQLLRDVRTSGRRVALLLGSNPTLWSESEATRETDRLLGLCSTLFAGRRELETLFGALAGDAAIDALHARGVTEVVIWDRSGGTLASAGEHRVQRKSTTLPVPASLAGRFLAHRLAGAEIEAALDDALLLKP